MIGCNISISADLLFFVLIFLLLFYDNTALLLLRNMKPAEGAGRNPEALFFLLVFLLLFCRVHTVPAGC